MDGLELRRLSADIGRAARNAEPKAKIIVAKTAIDIQKDAKVIADQKGVRDTGTLINEIHTYIDGLGATISPDASYSIFNELGTSRMPARPFMGPATDRNQGPFEEAMGSLGEAVFGG
ncbi:HK97-gp10 family putative phage morphogenesis protein [Arthrobacter burdickii]|uniref:HK97 gp10 family phage protein n=1 Tax=Arthrobacter burdickii TaxID=3035920 RepID=A0ABT8K3B7_9MICC|nr:HK97-gp10 family putative phage morphogenesis protein [Arthrobacter burdickii]MDN4611950.1 hypothetical protein [Arthrobacter burdickii]